MIEDGCFFIGHADAPPSIFPLLMDAIEKRIEQFGVRQFFFGNHGNFDRLVYRALAEIKGKYPGIQLILVTPYHPAVYPVEKPAMADEIFYPFEERIMPQYAIPRTNQKMICECRFLIAYVCHTGKARDFLEYALRRQKKEKRYIENIGSM